ncbi:MAG: O-antigen ligase family protein [Candidatus Kariarchaeaceae archaeon]
MSGREWDEYLLWILTLLFPALMTVKHGVSIVFYLMGLISIYVLMKKRPILKHISIYLLASFVLLIAVSLVSLLNTEDIENGMNRLKWILHFSGLLPMFMALATVKKNLLLPYLIGSCIGSFVILGITIHQVQIHDFARATGYYNSIMFGSMAVILALSCFIGLFSINSNKIFFFLLLLSFGGAFYATIFSEARGAWIGFLGGVSLGIFLLRQTIPKKKIYQIIVPCLIICISVGIAGKSVIRKRAQQATLAYIKSLNTEKEKLGGIGERLFLWNSAIKIWAQNPILGSGIGDFQHEFLELVHKGEIDSPALSLIDPVYAHSEIFGKLADTGVIGLLILIAATLVLPVIFFCMSIRSHAIGLDLHTSVFGVVSVVVFFIFGLTENWLAHKQLVMTYTLLLAIMGSSFALKRPIEKS